MRHRPPFGMPNPCGMPAKNIVYPTKCNEVHTCSESEVNHIHPSHTNVVNHHLVKNKHFYPHTTSYQNTVDEVNIYGGPGGPGGLGGPGGPGGPGMMNGPGTMGGQQPFQQNPFNNRR
ncbi:CotD family spore coat protein [Gracilibacillus sp. YIM 98692]|uniref:CotD family spore coat protein n=1 Tax=Gracilibacillus sp. YIM 98692 TaxID=2663532 RepID=UPI0013D28A35|nr:CotD family spore coat protein [Gracilibacillus sp. YIM 98692]